MERLAPHGLPIHTITLPTPFPVGPVNVYVVHSDALILFDTGPKSREAYLALDAGLSEVGLTLKDIDVIVATHGHIDHIGLLKRLVEESGADTYGHPFVVSQWIYSDEKAAQRRTYFLDLFAEYGAPEAETIACIDHWNSYREYTDEVQLDYALEQNSTLLGFTTHHLPGHSPSDLVFVHEALGFSITGDHLLPDISPNPLMRKPLPGQPKVKSLVEYRESLRRCRSLDLGHCFPGHGESFHGHQAIIDSLLRRHDRRTEHVLTLLHERPRTPYELSQLLFPRLETAYLYLGLSAAIGHLEVLEEEGRARPLPQAGHIVYGPVS